MITDSFDIGSAPIITPSSFYGEKGNIADTAIATFSREIYSAVLERFESEVICEIKAANRIKPVHLLNVGSTERKIVFYLSEIGSCLAATDAIEVCHRTGAEKLIMFGSAGALDKEKTGGKYVIPTEAYRDEGMSYHYAPPSDYIKIKNADKLERIFSEYKIPHVKGMVWTTDAIYMETRNLVDKRKSDGCVAVEMELAGVQAACDYYGMELYDFLVTGDVVDVNAGDYTPDGLSDANHSLDKFFVALKIAEALAK